MNKYVDTYSNLKTAKPVFKRKDGRLTAYALHCGYVQRAYNYNGERKVELYCEHGMYHVRYFDYPMDEREWETFDTVNEAWRCYSKLKRKLND